MPNLLQAGLIRSLGAVATAARTNASRESRPSGDFSSYLEAVRGGDRADRRNSADRTDAARSRDAAGESRAEKPRNERPEAKDTQNTDAAADSTEQAQVVVAANTAPIVIVTAAPVTKTDGESSADASGSPVTTAVTSGADQSTADSDSTSAGTKADDTREVVGNERPEAAERIAATRHSDNQVDASSPPAASEDSTAVQGQRLTEDDSTIDPPEDDDANAVVVNAEDRRLSKTAGKTSASTLAQQDRAGDATNAAADQENASRVAADSDSDRNTRTSNGGESLRDVRVRDALQRALNGGGNAADARHDAPQGDSNDANNDGHRHTQSASPVKSAGGDNLLKSEKVTNPESTPALPATASIRAADGDGVAAAIGRFLVATGETGGRGTTGRSEDSGSAPAVKPFDATALKQVSSPQFGLQAAGARSEATTSLGGAAAGRPGGTSTFSQILASRLDPSQSLELAARVLSAASSPNKWDVTLRLDPPELGSLRLVVRMEEGAMNLRVDADSRSAGRLIESRLGDLRDALAAHGISVERMQVVVKQDPSGQADTQQRHPSQDDAPANRHARQESTGEFTGQSDGGRTWDGGHGGRSNGDGAAWDGSAWAGWSGSGDSIAVESVRADVTPTSETSVNLVA